MLQRFLLTVAELFLTLSYPIPADSQEDLVQPDETHLEGVPVFIQHPKPLYYTTKNKPATIECVAEPVSHAAIKCAEQTIPYKGPGESGILEIQKLNSDNLPDPDGKRWKLRLEVRAKDVEEWFDTYVCHCEAWNKVVKLQRPKKVIKTEKSYQQYDRNQRSIFRRKIPIGTSFNRFSCQVYWLKDGKRVDTKSFPHIVINDYNHLIIENTTTSDSGNYTCVAACLNGEKRRAVARVNIFPQTLKRSDFPLYTLSKVSSQVPTYFESEVGLSRVNCGPHFSTPLAVSNLGGPIESSSDPSTANTGTTVTAIGSCNGGSSTGSVGLPLNRCLTNRSPNNYNINFLNMEIDECNEKCEPESGLYHELSLDTVSSDRSILCEFIDPLELNTTVRKTISCDGDQLALPQSGVFLTIPQGALQSNSLVEVYLAVCREDKHRPTLGDHQTLLSPVIQFGPVGLNLSKPVLLSFPHCAELNQSNWLIRVLALGPNLNRSPNNLNTSNINGYKCNYSALHTNLHNFIWQNLNHTEFQNFPNGISTNGLQNINITNLTNSNNIMTDSAQDSGLLSDIQPATKILKLAAFSGPLTPTIDYNIRVYVLTDTKDALEHVLYVEKRLEGRLLDDPKSLLFKDNGGGLCFCIEDISPGWRSRLQTKSQEIPFRHIWNGTQMSTLHCAFSLEHLDPRQLNVSCKIKVYQENSQVQEQVLKISNQKFELKTEHPRTRFFSSEDRSSDIRSFTSPYRLPVVTTQRLCKLLDEKEGEWQKLAKHMRMERYIFYLKSQPSPTTVLLNMWEACNRDEPSVNELKAIFSAMDRADCANLLE
ncbi:putative netrin receptor unc5 [Schistosoma mansoni]|uniref:putative netrin receptor unc5 n=1 Tax=Schistosoma mansoni TaxID=6183 RepID=UPI00022DCB79|nr:putative netrin receptor unc5 [Schistosoma mansoni]|eukprot:XP_018654639.1 putative netrin receptor unc5 [Schistosoma mansoni]